MVTPTLDIEINLWKKGYQLVCGIDEVGRGCFAGPVVVGAVVFPENVSLITGLRDSKLLSSKQREILDKLIKQSALMWAVAQVEVEVINQVGIGKATQQAFFNVVHQLDQFPQHLLIDAFYITDIDKNIQTPVQNGDKICASISAASIIAKVYRDNLMLQISEEYPNYSLHKNKGYGTQEHQDAIKKYGLTDIHRKSFNLDKFL